MEARLTDSGKRFKTLREAKKYLADHPWNSNVWSIYNIKGGRVYKYFVGSHIEWINR